MADTRHLDTAIAILGKKPVKKSNRPTIHLTTLPQGVSVQVNRKEVWLAPNMGEARKDALRRSDSMQRLKGTKPIIVEE